MINTYKQEWNEMHKKFAENPNNILKYDEWLEEFKTTIDAVNTEIIDLGCGVTGNNTLYLLNRNKKVISCDFAEEALKVVATHIPNSRTLLFDMTERFPFEDNFTDLIIADLSIHYFSKQVTINIINEIKRVLKNNGYLIFRVNSTKSTEYKEIKETSLEDNYYFIKGITKRFFSEKDILNFFYDWNIEFMKEENMDRWSDDKIVWKVMVKK